MDNIKKVQTELLEMKIAMSEMNNILDKNNRLNTAKQMISESETIAIETIQMKHAEKKWLTSHPPKKPHKPREPTEEGGGDRKNNGQYFSNLMEIIHP